MWQTIITGIIIAAVFIYVVAKIIRIFIHPEKVKCNCGCKGCPFLKENSCCSKPSQEKDIKGASLTFSLISHLSLTSANDQSYSMLTCRKKRVRDGETNFST